MRRADRALASSELLSFSLFSFFFLEFIFRRLMAAQLIVVSLSHSSPPGRSLPVSFSIFPALCWLFLLICCSEKTFLYLGFYQHRKQYYLCPSSLALPLSFFRESDITNVTSMSWSFTSAARADIISYMNLSVRDACPCSICLSLLLSKSWPLSSFSSVIISLCSEEPEE